MFRRGDDRGEDDRHEPIQERDVSSEGAGKGRGGQPSSEVTVIGQGARLEGTLVSAGSLRIDGQVKGKIKAEGDVTLASQSRVEADIEAQNVVVAGEFTGNIAAKSRAELAKGGRVSGNVTSKTLIVAEGAVFTGQSIMGDANVSAAGTGQPAGTSTAASTSSSSAAESAAEPAKARA